MKKLLLIFALLTSFVGNAQQAIRDISTTDVSNYNIFLRPFKLDLRASTTPGQITPKLFLGNLSVDTLVLSVARKVLAMGIQASINTNTALVNTASANATSALSIANAASANVSAAISSANTAITNANAVLSIANTANINAASALSIANTANTNVAGKAPINNPTFTGSRVGIESDSPTIYLKNSITSTGINAIELLPNNDVKIANGSILVNAFGGNPTVYVQNNNGNVGIGTITPTAKLDVVGALKLTNGTQGVGKFLSSDANGLSTWTLPNYLPLTGGTVAGNLFSTGHIYADVVDINTLHLDRGNLNNITVNDFFQYNHGTQAIGKFLRNSDGHGNVDYSFVPFGSLTEKPTTISGYGITDYNTTGDARYTQKSNNLSDLGSIVTARTNLGLGSLATQNGTFSGTSSGANTGDQTNILGNAATVTTNANSSGDVTSVGNITTIANNAVTNAKLAQMATKTYRGRTSAGTGNAEDVSVAVLKTDLGVDQINNTSDANKPISTAGTTALALKAPLNTPTFTGTSTFSGNIFSTGHIYADGVDINTLQLDRGNFNNITVGDFFQYNHGTQAIGKFLRNSDGHGNVDYSFVPFGSLTEKPTTISGYGITDYNTTGDVRYTQKSNNLSDLASIVTARTNLGLGSLATQNGTFSGTSSGANTGDQTNILGNAATVTTNANSSGDVTSVGNITTIANNAVTNAKLAQMATKTYRGRTSAGTGNAEDVSVAVLKTDLGVDQINNTSDANKPISTAEAAALLLKANVNTPSFTGTSTFGGSALFSSTTRFSNSIYQYWTDKDGASQRMVALDAANNFNIGDIDNYMSLGNMKYYTSNSHIFSSNGVETVRFTKTGNVGIGTNAPVAKLDVYGTGGTLPITGSTQTVASLALTNAATYSTMYFGALATSPYSTWIQSSARNDLSVFSPISLNPNGGNVGIGITNPFSRLHTVSTSADTQPIAIFQNSNPAGFAGIQIDRASIVRYALTQYSTAGTINWNTGISYNAGAGNSTYSIGTGINTSDSKLSILTTGNVGIGTITPISTLQSTGTITVGSGSSASDVGIMQLLGNLGSPFSNKITYGTDGTGYKFGIGKSQAGTVTDQFVIQDNGNIGVGTTTALAKLDVRGTGHFSDGTGTKIRIRTGGIIDFTNFAESAYVPGIFSASQFAFIGGNVGIGTAMPLGTLQIGEYNVNTNPNDLVLFAPSNGLATGNSIKFDMNVGGGFARSRLAEIQSISSDVTHNQLRFNLGTWNNNAVTSNVLTLQDDGKVGIGTTVPISPLHINKLTQTIGAVTPAGALVITDLANSNFALELGSNLSSGNWIQSRNAISQSYYNLLLNPSGGNVGIGTTSPASKFHVNSSGTVDTYITVGHASGGTIIGQRANNEGVIASYLATNLTFGYNLSSSFVETMRINTNGNLGLNQPNPTSKLHVVGSEASTFTSISTATTLAEHRYVVVTAAVALTLPTASTCAGRTYTINARAAGVTSTAFLNLSGTSVTTYTSGTSVTIISDATNWQQVQ